MPRRDGTGPIGIGAMTGRRAGFCNADFNDHGFIDLADSSDLAAYWLFTIN